MSILGFFVTTDRRMIGYGEGLIADFLKSSEIEYQYCEMLALVTTLKEKAEVNGIPIKEWFIQNTDISDWASFFRDYNVFKFVDFKKDWSGKHIRSMRELINAAFPENPKKRSYMDTLNFDNLIISKFKEEMSMDKFDCYIEKYTNDAGKLCARLREKESNRKIILDGDVFVKKHFLRFLSQAELNINIMPTIYDRHGIDIVAVRGIKQAEDAAGGVCCFYLNCDDIEGHKRVLSYFIKNDLIRKTKTGKLYNISFKLDDQTRAGEYGSGFHSEIKLEKFVNLNTGEFL